MNEMRVEHDQRIRAVQSKIRAFIKACGGTTTLHALRMYIETQERDDGIISRALVAPDGLFQMGRTSNGTPVVSLAVGEQA